MDDCGAGKYEGTEGRGATEGIEKFDDHSPDCSSSSSSLPSSSSSPSSLPSSLSSSSSSPFSSDSSSPSLRSFSSSRPRWSLLSSPEAGLMSEPINACGSISQSRLLSDSPFQGFSEDSSSDCSEDRGGVYPGGSDSSDS